MLASFLLGLVGGQRSMTPLAAVALAAANGHLPPGRAAPAFLRSDAAAGGALAGELPAHRPSRRRGHGRRPERVVAHGDA